METFWGYAGWTIVAATVASYVWLLFRIALFPKTPAADANTQEPRRAA